jgi:putative transposase
MKLLFLVLNRSEKEWKMPPREWAMAKSQFAILFADRFQAARAGDGHSSAIDRRSTL